MPVSANAAVGALPFVSVLMPVRNEGVFIDRSLHSVVVQDYPSDRLEILVADGMSSDDTRDRIRALQARHPNLHLLDNPGRIVATGLNSALARARGEIIVRVDGHCEIAPDYVARCVAHLESGVQAVGGRLKTIGENPISRLIAVAMSSRFGVGDSGFRTEGHGDRFTDTVAFPAYTRAIIDAAGPVDEELVRNQDDEYNYRLRKLGAKILLAGDVHANYYSRGSLRSLWRQYFQYGYWKVRVMQKHTWQMRPRQFVPPAFAAALTILLVAALVSSIGRWLLAGLVGSYVAANLLASVAVARTAGWHFLPLLPVTFVTLHLSYGFGFLKGLIAFRSRWGDVASGVRGRQYGAGTPASGAPDRVASGEPGHVIAPTTAPAGAAPADVRPDRTHERLS